jgi:hypothetical protein
MSLRGAVMGACEFESPALPPGLSAPHDLVLFSQLCPCICSPQGASNESLSNTLQFILSDAQDVRDTLPLAAHSIYLRKTSDMLLGPRLLRSFRLLC